MAKISFVVGTLSLLVHVFALVYFARTPAGQPLTYVPVVIISTIIFFLVTILSVADAVYGAFGFWQAGKRADVGRMLYAVTGATVGLLLIVTLHVIPRFLS